MARIAGVDIPREKRLVISLTYIYGIGRTSAGQICGGTHIDEAARGRGHHAADLPRGRRSVALAQDVNLPESQWRTRALPLP